MTLKHPEIRVLTFMDLTIFNKNSILTNAK